MFRGSLGPIDALGLLGFVNPVGHLVLLGPLGPLGPLRPLTFLTSWGPEAIGVLVQPLTLFLLLELLRPFCSLLAP